MAITISGKYTSSITLTSGNNPVSVTGTIDVAGNGALFGPSGVDDNTWTIANAGTINSGKGNGISLGDSSSVKSGIITNEIGGTISGSNYGIDIFGAGSVTNESGATILGHGAASGVRLSGAPGTVVNSGLIAGDIYAVRETAGGTVSNDGTIAAFSNGVIISGGSGTVTNAGTISGYTAAVSFDANFDDNLLIVEPGAVFAGKIFGGTGAVELTGTGTAPLSGFGTSITNFSSVQFDGGASWTISGNSAGLSAIGTISGFDSDDAIDLTGFVAKSIAFKDNTLTLTDKDGGDVVLNIEEDGDPTTIFQYTTSGGGTQIIEVACYRIGTRILTPSGEVPVEQLAIGDLLVTRSGEAKPILWIGRRSYDGRLIAGRRNILPIRIAAGAIADGVPHRDLDVSPGHALLFSEGLVAAEKLLNGISIVQLEAVDSVEYVHLELAAHDAIFAEGALAETYVECDNRGQFQNGHEFERLYPDLDAPKWAYCAPRIEHGDDLAAVRRNLDDRLEALGHAKSLDPALRLVVDGREIQPDVVRGWNYVFRVPQQPTDVRIVSNATVPAGMEGSTDTRRLGVNLSCLILRNASATLMVEHTDQSLTDGFHNAEEAHRWTDGDARIPPVFLACFQQGLTIEVRTLGPGLAYRTGRWGGAETEANVANDEVAGVNAMKKRRTGRVKRRSFSS